MNSLCLQIGTATSSDAGAFTQTLQASNASDIAHCRAQLPPSSLDALLLVVSSDDLSKPDVFNPMELANWISVLTATAYVAIQVNESSSSSSGSSTSDLQPVHTSFLLAGLAMASERKTANGSRILTAQRKASAVTHSVPLLKKKVNHNTVVKISVDEEEEVEDMKIDEDDLLDDNVLAPPPAMGARTAGDDCDGRKPCDNCSCGRAEELQQEKVAASQPERTKNAPSSSCGKCSLGDAFRCASCPYLGKPAFKAGEEHLVLDLADDF